jgi:hypothetical protein
VKGIIGGDGGKKAESDERAVRKKKETLKRELAPLSEGSSTTQEVLPLFRGNIDQKENTTIGEAVIIKRKVTENSKIPLSTGSEKVIIRYTDGTEKISPQETLLLLVDIMSSCMAW